MADYRVEPNGSGGFDVLKDGRAFRYDLTDLEEVQRAIGDDGGRAFTLIEDDGYLTTNRVGR